MCHISTDPNSCLPTTHHYINSRDSTEEPNTHISFRTINTSQSFLGLQRRVTLPQHNAILTNAHVLDIQYAFHLQMVDDGQFSTLCDINIDVNKTCAALSAAALRRQRVGLHVNWWDSEKHVVVLNIHIHMSRETTLGCYWAIQ